MKKDDLLFIVSPLFSPLRREREREREREPEETEHYLHYFGLLIRG